MTVVVFLAMYFNNQDENGELIQETVVSMTGLFLFDSLFLLYWLPTVTSTPGLLRRQTVPFAILVNDLIDRN